MTFLAATLLTLLIPASFAYDGPIQNSEIIAVLADCSAAGLVYSNVSSKQPIITSRLALDETTEADGVEITQRHRLSRSRFYIYDQWCDAPPDHGYTGKRSYFKQALAHGAVVDKLSTCRRSQGVADGTPVDEYAILTVGNLSLRPTKIECKID